jgi:rare lipoprotein A (peptidoglycan hydrolase)
MACGGALSGGTMGVANKTLPCGTRLTFLYAGREVRVTVMDRGPYVAGRDFDLAPGTADALGMHAVASVRWRKGW